MSLDEAAVGAFAYRLREPCLLREAQANRLQSVEANLVKALALYQYPVLVPVRKKVPTQGFKLRVGVIPWHGWVAHSMGETGRFLDVNRHFPGQPQAACLGFDQAEPRLACPPQGGPEASRCAIVRRVEPEGSPHIIALHRPLLEAEEGNEPLGAHRKRDRISVARQLEPRQEHQLNATRHGYGYDLDQPSPARHRSVTGAGAGVARRAMPAVPSA